MKQLQNNFTTPEQSKRLLDLGVPADSADCYQVPNGLFPHPYVLVDLFSKTDFIPPKDEVLPCWSAGRLIEIYITCIEHYTGDERLTFGQDTVRLGMIDCIIAAIEVGCDDGEIDFSKLEE